MNLMNVFKGGDKILISDDGKEYSTLIDEIFDDANFSILQPFYKGRSVSLELGQEYKFTCIKGGGLHYFNAIVIRSDLSGQVNITYVRYTGNYLRLQRRSAYRVRVQLDVQVRKQAEKNEPSGEWEHARTLDISETGMRVRLGPNFDKGDVLQCNITINQCDICTTLPTITGEIKRSSPLQNKANESICGVEFISIDDKAQDILLKLVMRSQRNPFTQ